MDLTDYQRMPDPMLDHVIKQLEANVHALRMSSSAIGRALFDEYRERLDLARAEFERRRV